MPANTTHPDYDASAAEWVRARDVLAGEDAVKAAGERYLPRLESQPEDEFLAYRNRAAFFNATARTAEGYIGLIFRRAPFVKTPAPSGVAPSGVGRALSEFTNDCDMLGTTLYGYTKNVVQEVIAVGRAGTLIDWEGEVENRVYTSLYTAEQIINWRVERVNGRNIPTLIVLKETGVSRVAQAPKDSFVDEFVDQIRVLRLIEDVAPRPSGTLGKRAFKCVVEIWQPKVSKSGQRKTAKVEWELVEARTPLRLGKPLPLIPFVFHGPRHSRPAVAKVPLTDIIAINLDHYRLNADYKHGMHFTALPTAWVSGFPKNSELEIGSRTAWVTETQGGTAGFLEFTGQGLTTFERAMEQDERMLALLGSRLLESQKRVGETAQAIELRQSGENSILANIATSISESLTQVLRWAYWWNSTEATPEDVSDSLVRVELNTDFSTKWLAGPELQAVVAAWQAGAISQDTMLELFRKGEILPDGRTNAEELTLIKATANTVVPMQPTTAAADAAQPTNGTV